MLDSTFSFFSILERKEDDKKHAVVHAPPKDEHSISLCKNHPFITYFRPGINFVFTIRRLKSTFKRITIETFTRYQLRIDLLAVQQKGLDRALSLYIFIREIRSSGVRASITIVHIRKFCKM